MAGENGVLSHDGKNAGAGIIRAESSPGPESLKMRLFRLATGLVAGVAILVSGVWGLSKLLGTPESSYRGKPPDYWVMQVSSPDAAVSNAAVVVLNDEIIPHLTNVMLHDFSDSTFKLRVIDMLNGLPGISVDFEPADSRRKAAAYELGEYGPAARKAVPALVKALISRDYAVGETAAQSLGAIHADPQEVIPVLTLYLVDEKVNVGAATALGKFGAQAQPAVPGLMRMWQRGDGEAKLAAGGALQLIDATAYAQMMQTGPSKINGAGAPAGR
jgi:hypothetical protein